jgi:serine/threonine protein kinase/formylglycine-generating enzyme required for sulfatase activity
VSAEPVRFTCPRCAKRYKTPRSRLEQAGGRLGVLCSGCQARLRVVLEEGGARAELLSDEAGAGDVHHRDLEEDAPEAGETRPPPAAAHADAPVQGQVPEIGTRLGRYQLEGLVGRGGMGAVFRAFDPAANRHVALKVLPPGAAPAAAARFQREIEVQGNIHHPNLMPIFDSGESSGFRWYTMELLREPLSLHDLTLLAHSGQAARSPRLKPVATLEGLVRHVLIPVCRAIHHANAHEGVLHRDLTPANVLMDAVGVRPYVIDFGVCTLIERKNTRLANVPLETSPVVDGQRTVTGTLVYMPPEQLRGQSDRRGDVWALGALLHAVVTGEPPLAPAAKAVVPKSARIEGLRLLIEQAEREGNTTEAHAFRESVLALEEGRERTQADLHKDVLRGNYQPRPPWIDPALDAVIAKAMAVDPANRYRNARNLAEDLEAWLGGDAVEALAEKQSGFGRIAYRARLGFRRHRGLVTVGALVLLAAGAWLLWPRGDTGPTPEQRAAPHLALAEAAVTREDWPAAGRAARLALEQDPKSARAWAVWNRAGGGEKDAADLRWAEGLAAEAKAADARGDLAGGAEARVRLKAALDRICGRDCGAEAPAAAWQQRLVDVMRNERPLECVLPTGAHVNQIYRVDERGHLRPPTKGLVGPKWVTPGITPGRWVLAVSSGPNFVFVPFEVTPQAERVKVVCPVDPATLPPGTVYVPGGRAKGPLGETQVRALLWERTEVTAERYAAWLATLPAEEQEQRVPRVAGALGERPQAIWQRKDGRYAQAAHLNGQNPVEGVSLYDARAFASAQGRQLPTAQEWAWAATGPFGAPTPVGSLDALVSPGLFVGPAARGVQPVGYGEQVDVTPFGLLDMAGNLAEWTGSLATFEGTNGWLVMGSGYGLPLERALVTRAVPEPGWKPLLGVGFRCVLPAP